MWPLVASLQAILDRTLRRCAVSDASQAKCSGNRAMPEASVAHFAKRPAGGLHSAPIGSSGGGRPPVGKRRLSPPTVRPAVRPALRRPVHPSLVHVARARCFDHGPVKSVPPSSSSRLRFPGFLTPTSCRCCRDSPRRSPGVFGPRQRRPASRHEERAGRLEHPNLRRGRSVWSLPRPARACARSFQFCSNRPQPAGKR